MINNTNENFNDGVNSILIQPLQPERLIKSEEEKLEQSTNELYKKIIDFLETSLNPSLKKEDSKEFFKINKNLKLILNEIKFNKSEYDGYALKLEDLKQELELLQKIWNILLEININTFLEELKEYELNPNSNKKIRELCEELENLLTFYKKNINYKANEINIENEKNKENKNFNNHKDIRKVYEELIRVDGYFNKLIKSLRKMATFRISQDIWSTNGTIEDEGNENKEIEIYGSHKIMKKDKVFRIFLDVYMELKKNRGVFRKLLDHVKDLNYLEEVVKKEENFLKYIFSYLENIVRFLNVNNNDQYYGNFNLSILNLNNDFYKYYRPYSPDSYIVKFKYVVYDVIKKFYFKEIKNIENKIGKKIEKLDEKECVRDEKEEEELKEIYKNLAKENDAYYNFIFRVVFDSINKEILNLNIFNNRCKVNYKYEMQKFYNLQNMCGTLFKVSSDFIKNLVKSNPVKYYKDIIYCLENEKAMLREIYDFIMSYVPELKDKEKFINVDFEKFSEKEKAEIKKEKEKIKNSFKKAFSEEIEKIKDPVVIRDDFEKLSSSFPAITEKFYEDEDDEYGENFYMFTTFICDKAKIEDTNFNSIFNKINSLVDKYGNLKQNKTKNNEAVKDDSFLGRLYKLLNKTIKFYFNEKNGKFYFYETFNRLSNQFLK